MSHELATAFKNVTALTSPYVVSELELGGYEINPETIIAAREIAPKVFAVIFKCHVEDTYITTTIKHRDYYVTTYEGSHLSTALNYWLAMLTSNARI